MPVPHRVTIGAYNSAGELVKLLFDGHAQFLPGDLLLSGDSLGAGSGEGIDLSFPGHLSKDGVQIGNSLKWLGDNNNGQAVDSGVYYLKAEIRDQFDNVSTLTKSVAVVNVSTGNSLAIYNSAGELVYSADLALLSTGLGAPAGTRFVSLSLGADNYAPEFDAASGSQAGLLPIHVRDENGAEYTYYWDGRSSRGNLVASGNYQVQLIYRAAGGAKTVESREVSVLRSSDPSAQISAVLGPNPALRGAEVKVVYRPSAGIACIARVYNLAGELVGQGEDLRSSGSFTLATERFASGTYLVVLEKIVGAQSVQSRQLLKLAVIR